MGAVGSSDRDGHVRAVCDDRGTLRRIVEQPATAGSQVAFEPLRTVGSAVDGDVPIAGATEQVVGSPAWAVGDGMAAFQSVAELQSVL